VYDQREEDIWIVEAQLEVMKLLDECMKEYLGKRYGIQTQGGAGQDIGTQEAGSQAPIGPAGY
jgi:hypothetical protein